MNNRTAGFFDADENQGKKGAINDQLDVEHPEWNVQSHFHLSGMEAVEGDLPSPIQNSNNSTKRRSHSDTR